jgi:primosomal protein N''
MTDQEQIDALKAQINRLRHCLEQARNDKDKEAFERCYGRTLAMTSDQCLADVKVKAIESVREQIGLLQRYSFLALHQNPSVTKMPDQSGRWIDRDAVDDLIEKHINSLLEQAR